MICNAILRYKVMKKIPGYIYFFYGIRCKRYCQRGIRLCNYSAAGALC